MIIRKATPADSAVLGQLASRMWDHDPAALADEFQSMTASDEAACFLAETEGTAIGFAQCQLRHDYVEGCSSSPVGFLEGVFVDDEHRRSGVARSLLQACEDWAQSIGCQEFASDCELDNHLSLMWHLSSGFTEAGRTIWFTKKLTE